MEVVSKMTRYGISLIPTMKIMINGVPQWKWGVHVDFRPDGDGKASFNTKDWVKTGAKSERQLIDLLKNHEVCGKNYWIVREPEPVVVDKPQKKSKKELVDV